jgi:hypothetical protein
MGNMKEKLLNIVRQHQESQPISVRSLANRLRISQSKALELCEDLGLCINVAIGNGSGYAELEKGDYTIEDLAASAAEGK